jgi:glutamate N-acetyltransferase/amino-acid N-acetyltransferase
MTAISPLAPPQPQVLPPVPGVRFATAAAGIRVRNRTDVLLVALDAGTEVAGVLTRSRCPSAAVDWCRERLPAGRARGVLVNSGNANAFTGMRGRQAVAASADHAAAALGCRAAEIMVASTGVIGEPLDPEKFAAVLGAAATRLAAEPWAAAAQAIMTTDTFPKVATRAASVGGVPVAIAGIAKGSGMIAPDMATMLSFIFTDAPIAAPVLQRLLARAVAGSFNAVTVDGDTSTSDTVLLFATGAAAARGAPRITEPGDRRLAPFRRALGALTLDLAHQIVRDGEGARKFVAVTVEGAVSARSAKRIALSIANSPLVKTALAGEDANWGRIVMAVGKAGEPADRDRLAIWFGDVRVAVAGARDPEYAEAAAAAVMQRPEIAIRVDLGLGRGRATVWTCDLTKRYVEINGDYRS